MKHIALLLGGPDGPRRRALVNPGLEHIEMTVRAAEIRTRHVFDLDSLPVDRHHYRLYPMPTWENTRLWLAIYRGVR